MSLPPGETRRAAIVTGALLAGAVVWHLLLPAFFYRSAGVWLEGPLPAAIGAAFGLWLHRREPPLLQALAACGWAIAASLVAVLLGGTVIFGPLPALAGAFTLLRNGVRLPFLDVVTAAGSPYVLYLAWMSFKALLLWGALAYLVMLMRQPDGRTWLHSRLTGLGDQRAFSVEQKRQWQAYRSQYLAAVRAGDQPPAAPASLVPHLAAGGGWSDQARLAYWLLRIGLAIAGAFGLYALLSAALSETALSLMLRGVFGR